jgi:hypothetical protein
MTEKCYRCGSANIRAINVEMSFAPTKAEPVYASAKAIVCLECGLVEYSLSEQPLKTLRQVVSADSGPGIPRVA